MKLVLIFSLLMFGTVNVFADEVLTAKELQRLCMKSKNISFQNKIRQECIKDLINKKQDVLETDAITYIDKICTSRYNSNFDRVLNKIMDSSTSENMGLGSTPNWRSCTNKLLEYISQYPTSKKSSLDYRLGMILKIRGAVIGGYKSNVVIKGKNHYLNDIYTVLCPERPADGSKIVDDCEKSVDEAYKNMDYIKNLKEEETKENNKKAAKEATKKAAHDKLLEETEQGKYSPPPTKSGGAK